MAAGLPVIAVRASGVKDVVVQGETGYLSKEDIYEWEEKLEQVRVDAESNAPTDFIIDIAYPADLKDKPKRSIIALIGGISCTFLAIFVLILRDRTKAVKAQNEIN